MQITLNACGKRYNYDWIFRNLCYQFNSNNSYAILGINGSGKSTLLQCLSSYQEFSEGSINYQISTDNIEDSQIYQRLSLVTPYMELIEEFTLEETIRFHNQFKKLTKGIDEEFMIELLKLSKHKSKQIRYFSSGMKQRVKLLLAFCSDTELLLLDEPTSNLDSQGVEWYQMMIEKYSENKLLIIASNDEREYSFCKEKISITDFKH